MSFTAGEYLRATGEAAAESRSVAETRTDLGIDSNDVVAFGEVQAILTPKSTLTPVAASGSVYSDAAVLGSSSVVHITSDSTAKGVSLAVALGDDFKVIINDSSTAAKLYAATGGVLNGLAPNAAVVIPASKGVVCFCTTDDTWVVFDLPAKATAA